MALQSLAIVPVTLLATSAVSIREDFTFTETQLGVSVAVVFGVASLCSIPAGRVSQRLGAARSMRIACSMTTVAVATLGLTSSSFASMVPLLAICGVGCALIQPSTDLWITRVVPPHRHGFAFGLKQAAGGPLIGLVAGALVPLSLATTGWRGAFVTIAVVATGLWWLARSFDEPVAPAGKPSRASDVALGPLLVLSAAVGLATVAQTAFLSFAVSSGVDAGLTEVGAALAFSAASVLGVAMRIALGVHADRRDHDLLITVGVMLVVSVGGFLLMALAQPFPSVVGTMVLAVSAWGWQGLLFLAIVRTNPGAPAMASGIVASGGLVGGVTGPLAFGVIATHDFSAGWIVMCVLSIVATATLLVARRSLIADAARRVDTAS